jgi:hypothetical protein
MIPRALFALAFVILAPAAAAAQPTVDALRLYLGATGSSCVLRTGTGSPEAAVTATVCTQYLNITDGKWWRKASGSGNTGWVLAGAISGAQYCVVYLTAVDTPGCSVDFTFNGSLLTSPELEVTAEAAEIVMAPAFLRLSGPHETQLRTQWFVDEVDSVVRLDAYDADGDVYLPLKVRSTSVDILNPLLPFTTNTSSLGTAAKRFASLHAVDLMVQTLTAVDVMATIGGRIIVAPTSYLTADLASGGTTITLKHNNFANGDRIVMEKAGQLEWMAIASAAGGSAGLYTYTVTRNLDGSGANDWLIGDAAVTTGATGDGYIDLASEQGIIPGTTVGPTIAFNVRTGTTWSDIAPRAAVGNLNGLYGYVADTYGAAFGDASNAWIKIDATNGVRIGHNATTKIELTAAGDASFTGTITAAAGLIGGWEIGATYLRAAADDVGISSAVTGGDDIRFWAGDATMASAEFRVTEAGALTATNATITGSITATAGAIGGCTIAATSITCGSGFSVSNAGVIAATSGTIGGWTLGSTSLTGTNVGLSSAVTGSLDYRFWSGDNTASAAEFSVDEDGYLRSIAATFGGGSSGVDVDSNGMIVNGTGRIRAGDAELNSDGLTLYSAEATGNRIKWDASGNYISGAGGGVRIAAAGEYAEFDGAAFFPTADEITLGTTGDPWGPIFALLTASTADEKPVVMLASGELRHKTDGTGSTSCAGGQFVDGVTAESGILIGISCSTPFVLSEVALLRREVAELRDLVAALLRRERPW